MSFIYSRALMNAYERCTSLREPVAAFSGGSCSDINAFAQSNGSLTPNPSWWHDKTMVTSRHSRFGMTCKPLTESRGAELLTWWLEGFPAKTYLSQEKAQESTVPGAACGDTWLGWLAKFDPVSSSWKTAQLSLIGDSGESLATFPRSGMTRGGLLWELPMLELRTDETASGYWPTPVASDTGSRKKPYAQGGTPLSLAVKIWPTPQASDNRNRGTTKTPAIARRIEAGKQVMLSMCMDGPLNPDWTEWLMGWPIGWSDLRPSGMVKFQPVQPQHGELLEGLEA